MKTHIKIRSLKILAILLVLLGVTVTWQDARALVTCEANEFGDWSTLDWSCGHVPISTDDVVINDSVTLDIPAEVNNLTIVYDDTPISGDLTTDEDLTINGDFTLYTNAFLDPSSATIIFAGTDVTQTISGDGEFYNLTIANSGSGWVILNENDSISIAGSLTILPGGKFAYTSELIDLFDPTGFPLINNGSLRITKYVSAATEFPSPSIVGYYGLDLVPPTGPDLGDVTVTIRHLESGDSCLTNMSTNYAGRCFTVDPPLPAGTTVTLWVHDDERNSITPGSLTPYQFTDPQWTVLDSVSPGGGPDYYYAQGVTNAGGGANFLLGSGTAPTAINLLSLNASSGGWNGQTAAIGLAVILLAALGIFLWHRQRQRA